MMHITKDIKERLIKSKVDEEFQNEEQIDKSELLRKQQDLIRKMHIKYVKYFNHWKDYDFLTCILAIIGLILAVYDVFLPSKILESIV